MFIWQFIDQGDVSPCFIRRRLAVAHQYNTEMLPYMFTVWKDSYTRYGIYYTQSIQYSGYLQEPFTDMV